jgi:hypothetical protein
LVRGLLYSGYSHLAPPGGAEGRMSGGDRDLDRARHGPQDSSEGSISEASDWPVGVRGPSSGEGRWPNGFLVEKQAHRSGCVRQVTEREELAQKLVERYTRDCSGRGAHEPLEGKAPERLHDSRTPVVGTRISLENRRVGRCAETELAQSRLVRGPRRPAAGISRTTVRTKVEVSAAEFLSASARGGRRDEPSR